MNYDVSDPLSILQYGKKLESKTFEDVILDSNLTDSEKTTLMNLYGNPSHKGGLGTLIEEAFFEYKPNNNQAPDFEEAGVELKVTPFVITQRGLYSAGERVVITMIPFDKPIEEDFKTSHVFSKLKLILFVHYHRTKDEINKLNYPIRFVTLFSPPEKDLKIIEQDFNKIVSIVQAGKAHELSEGDTMYLGACTKGSTALKSSVPQFYNPEIKAKKRAFSFKTSYMTYILRNYILNRTDTYEPIVKDTDILDAQNFENIIINRINRYKGKTEAQLSELFGIDNLRQTDEQVKHFLSMVAFRMLGIKSNQAEEFVKADIDVKVIRIEENGKMEESMSFPSIPLKKIAEDEWEDSIFYDVLQSKRLLFVVFHKKNGFYYLKGCQLWNMPVEDLEVKAREGYENIRNVIREGVVFTKKYGKNLIIKNNLPKKEDNEILHIRPHSSKRYYVLDGGEIIGENPRYGDELPDGRMMTKQSLWLNNDYIIKQLNPELKSIK